MWLDGGHVNEHVQSDRENMIGWEDELSLLINTSLVLSGPGISAGI